MREKVSAEERVREIRRKTRKKYSAEEKVRVVLEGLRGEESIAELCRKEGIPSNLSLPVEQGVSRGWEETTGRGHEAGRHIERSDRTAPGEQQLKQAVAKMLLKNRFLKKTLNVVDSESSAI